MGGYGEPVSISVVQDEAVDLAPANKLNFAGAGVSVAVSGGVATVTIAGAAAGSQKFCFAHTGSLNQYVMPTSPSGRAALDFPLYRAVGGETITNLRVEGRTAAGDTVTYEIQKSSDQGTTVASLAVAFSASVTVGNKTGVNAGPSVALTAGDWITAKMTADNGGAGGDWAILFTVQS